MNADLKRWVAMFSHGGTMKAQIMEWVVRVSGGRRSSARTIPPQKEDGQRELPLLYLSAWLRSVLLYLALYWCNQIFWGMFGLFF